MTFFPSVDSPNEDVGTSAAVGMDRSTPIRRAVADRSPIHLRGGSQESRRWPQYRRPRFRFRRPPITVGAATSGPATAPTLHSRSTRPSRRNGRRRSTRRGRLARHCLHLAVAGPHRPGDDQLNDSCHNNAPYNAPEWRALVACQELVTASNPLGPPANTSPNAHDYDQLKTIYNHDDGITATTAGTNFGIRQVG